MAKEIQIRFSELIRTYLPPHKRTPNRITWLTSLVNLQKIFDVFSQWRGNYRYKIALNGQLAVLQGHLTKTFGDGVLIKSYEDGYISIGLTSETAHWLPMGLINEGYPVNFPLLGEGGQEFDGMDFLVIIPSDVNVALVRAEIEKYKLADKNYKIITN